MSTLREKISKGGWGGSNPWCSIKQDESPTHYQLSYSGPLIEQSTSCKPLPHTYTHHLQPCPHSPFRFEPTVLSKKTALYISWGRQLISPSTQILTLFSYRISNSLRTVCRSTSCCSRISRRASSSRCSYSCSRRPSTSSIFVVVRTRDSSSSCEVKMDDVNNNVRHQSWSKAPEHGRMCHDVFRD